MSGRRQYRQNRNTEWPHMTTLNNSNNILHESVNYREHSVPVYNSAFEPPNPNGFPRFQSGQREEFILDSVPTDNIYSRPPSLKCEEDRSSILRIGDRFRRGSTCSVVLCVILVLLLIAVIISAVVLSVILSQNILSTGSIKYFQSEATLNNANFTEGLTDVNSPEFKQLANEFCEALKAMYTSSESPIQQDYTDCEVLGFSRGSVVVRFRIGTKYFSSRNPKEEIPKLLNQLKSHLKYMVTQKGSWNSLSFDETKIQPFKEEVVLTDTKIWETTPSLVQFTSSNTLLDGIPLLSSADGTIISQQIDKTPSSAQQNTEIMDKSQLGTQQMTDILDKFPSRTEHMTAILDKSQSITQLMTEILDISASGREQIKELSDSSPSSTHQITEIFDTSSPGTAQMTVIFNESPAERQSMTDILDKSPARTQKITDVLDKSPSITQQKTRSVDTSPSRRQRMTTILDKSEQTTVVFDKSLMTEILDKLPSKTHAFTLFEQSNLIYESVSFASVTMSYKSKYSFMNTSVAKPDESVTVISDRYLLYSTSDSNSRKQTATPSQESILHTKVPSFFSKSFSSIATSFPIQETSTDGQLAKTQITPTSSQPESTYIAKTFIPDKPILSTKYFQTESSVSSQMSTTADTASQILTSDTNQEAVTIGHAGTSKKDSLFDSAIPSRKDIFTEPSWLIQSSKHIGAPPMTSISEKVISFDYETITELKELNIFPTEEFARSSILTTPNITETSIPWKSEPAQPISLNDKPSPLVNISRLDDSFHKYAASSESLIVTPKISTDALSTSSLIISTQYTQSLPTNLPSPSTAATEFLNTKNIIKDTEVFPEYASHALSKHISTSPFSNVARITATLRSTSKDSQRKSTSEPMTRTSLDTTPLSATPVLQDILSTASIADSQLLQDTSLKIPMIMSSDVLNVTKTIKTLTPQNIPTTTIIDASVETKLSGHRETSFVSDYVYSSKDTVTQTTNPTNVSMSLQLLNITSQTKRLDETIVDSFGPSPKMMESLAATDSIIFEPLDIDGMSSRFENVNIMSSSISTDAVITSEEFDLFKSDIDGLSQVLVKTSEYLPITTGIDTSAISGSINLTTHTFNASLLDKSANNLAVLQTTLIQPKSSLLSTTPLGIVTDKTITVDPVNKSSPSGWHLSTSLNASKQGKRETQTSSNSIGYKYTKTKDTLISTRGGLSASTQNATTLASEYVPSILSTPSSFPIVTDEIQITRFTPDSPFSMSELLTATYYPGAFSTLNPNYPQATRFNPELFPFSLSKEIEKIVLTRQVGPLLISDEFERIRLRSASMPSRISPSLNGIPLSSNVIFEQEPTLLPPIGELHTLLTSSNENHLVNPYFIHDGSRENASTIDSQQKVNLSNINEIIKENFSTNDFGLKPNLSMIDENHQVNLSAIDFRLKLKLSMADENNQANLSANDFGLKQNLSMIVENHQANISANNFELKRNLSMVAEKDKTNLSAIDFGLKLNSSMIDENDQENLSAIDFRLKPNLSMIDENKQANLSANDFGLKPNLSMIVENHQANISANNFELKRNLSMIDEIDKTNLSAIDFGLKPNLSMIDENQVNISAIDFGLNLNSSMIDDIDKTNLSTIDFQEKQNISGIQENYHSNSSKNVSITNDLMNQKSNVINQTDITTKNFRIKSNLSIPTAMSNVTLSTIDTKHNQNLSSVHGKIKTNVSIISFAQNQTISNVDDIQEANILTIDFETKLNISSAINDQNTGNASDIKPISKVNISAIYYGQKSNLSRIIENYKPNTSLIQQDHLLKVSAVDETFHSTDVSITNAVTDGNASMIDFTEKQNFTLSDETGQLTKFSQSKIHADKSSLLDISESDLKSEMTSYYPQITTLPVITSEVLRLHGSLPIINHSRQQTQIALLDVSDFTDTMEDVNHLKTISGEIPITNAILGTKIESDIGLLSIRRGFLSSIDLPIVQGFDSDLYISPTKTLSLDISLNEKDVPNYTKSLVYPSNITFLNKAESNLNERSVEESTILSAMTDTILDISSSFMFEVQETSDKPRDKTSTLVVSSSIGNFETSAARTIEDNQNVSSNIAITESTPMSTKIELPVSIQTKNDSITRTVLSTSVADNRLSKTIFTINTTGHLSTSVSSSSYFQSNDMYISLHNVTLTLGEENKTQPLPNDKKRWE